MVVVPVVVDIEPVLVEVADIDTVAVRSDIVCPSSSVTLEIEVYCQRLISSLSCILFGSKRCFRYLR